MKSGISRTLADEVSSAGVFRFREPYFGSSIN
jgi:hypothetical protein